MLRLIAIVLALCALAGCKAPSTRPATAPAFLFALPASALPGGLAEQQRLSFEHGGRRETVDAQVEVDADSVRLVIHGQGQIALRMTWDGQRLSQTRMAWLPESLEAARVLSDLQLVFWPVEALREALPDGWTLATSGDERTLSDAHAVVARVAQPAPNQRVLRQLREGYVLTIESVPLPP
ncbi:DUF3261 domain-containing protein [Arenimonas alkanexedens]